MKFLMQHPRNYINDKSRYIFWISTSYKNVTDLQRWKYESKIIKAVEND